MTKTNPDQQDRLLWGRLTGVQKNRMRKLRDMYYRPSEIAELIQFNVRQFYFVYIKAGCPHYRDERRHLWVNGKEFREWIEKTYKKLDLAEGQGYCRTCDRGVEIANPVMKTTKDGETDFLVGKCKKCGRNIARFIANRRGC